MSTIHGELQQHVDYFYCEECKKHVPCLRLEPGVWEVQCPRCVGECALCGCHLAGYCFGKGKVPVRTHMYIVKPERAITGRADDGKISRSGEATRIPRR